MHVIIATDTFALSGGSRQAIYQAQALHHMGIRVTMVIKEHALLHGLLPPTIAKQCYHGGAFAMAHAIRQCICKDEPTIIHSYHNTALKVLSFWGMLWKMEYPHVRCVAHRGVSTHPRNPLPYWATGIDCFIPNSHAVAKQLHHFLPWSNVISVIYNGIPKERITPRQQSIRIRTTLQLPRDACIFISIVNNSERKGIRELLHAFSRLRGNAHLITIGLQEHVVRTLITDENILSRIHIIHTHDVADYLVHGDCFVFPSIAFDSLPNVILEAMGVGLPIIATHVGGTPELIQGNGILIPPKNIPALTEAMEYVIENPHIRQSWAMQSREHFKHFTIEERTHRLLELYSTLLARPAR